LTGQIKEMTGNLKKINKAFVTFTNSSFTKKALSKLPEGLKKCSASLSHDAGDIIWNNFHVSKCNRLFRVLVSYLITFFVILFVAAGASFALYLQIILIFDSTQITSIFGGILTLTETKRFLTPSLVNVLISILEWAPYFIVFLTNSMDGVIKGLILLFLISPTAITKSERHISRNSYYSSLIIKLVVFLFCNIALPPFLVVFFLLGPQAQNGATSVFFLHNFLGLVVCQIIVSQIFIVKCVRYIKDLIRISIAFARSFPLKQFYRYSEKRIEILKTFIEKRNPKRPQYEFIYGIARNLNILVLMMSIGPLVPLVLVFGCFYFLIDFLFERFHILYFSEKSHHSGNRILKRIPIILFFYIVASSVAHLLFIQLSASPTQLYLTLGVLGMEVVVAILFFFFSIGYSMVRRRIILGEYENKTTGVSYKHPYQETMHSFLEKEMDEFEGNGNVQISTNNLSMYVKE
jgi:hypothetical protein